MLKITTHTVVKNEENWIWYALMSVRDLVDKMLIFDDASTDKTWEIIKSIKDPKIGATRGSFAVASEIRNQMLEQTETDWFLILDGDEIWNRETFKELLSFLESCPKDIWGVVMRVRNCVGDVYHYQPETAGRYKILGKTGNLNIRAYRKLTNLRWQWDFPRETYGDASNVPINDQPGHLRFFNGFYWHMTFMPRTGVPADRKYRQKTSVEMGIKIKAERELPEVFFLKRPGIVPDPLKKRNWQYETKAALITPLKEIKRSLWNQ